MLDVIAWQTALANHAAVPAFFTKLGQLLQDGISGFGYVVGQPFGPLVVAIPGAVGTSRYYTVRDAQSERRWRLLATLSIHCPTSLPYGTADLALQLEAEGGPVLRQIPDVAAEAILLNHADVDDGITWVLSQLQEQLVRRDVLSAHCMEFAAHITEDMAP